MPALSSRAPSWRAWRCWVRQHRATEPALLPLLTDVLLTLLARARRKRPLLNAHREHLYQLWLSGTGRSHGALAWRVWSLTAAYGGAALLIQGRSPLAQLLTFGALVVLSALGWAALRARYAAEP